jgi:hypothetical protein
VFNSFDHVLLREEGAERGCVLAADGKESFCGAVERVGLGVNKTK